MEVNKAQSIQRTRPSQDGKAQNSGYRNEIRAEIVDIRRDSMVVRSPNGTLITGRLAADASPIDARIGETHTFTVSRGENGEIILEMHAKGHGIRQESAVRDALTTLGVTPNANNIRLALALIEKQIPVTKENMQRAAQGARLLGNETLEKMLFFLENDIPVAPRLTSVFDSLLSGQFKINEQLQGLVDGLRSLSDNGLGIRLADILVRGEAALNQGELAAKLSHAVVSKFGAALPPEQISAMIHHAFSNPHLREQGVAQLAEMLTKQLPDAREHVAEASQTRTNFTQIINNNRENLAVWLAQNIRGDTTDAQRFTELLREVLANAGTAAKEMASTQSGVKAALAAVFDGDNAQLAKTMEAMGLARGLALEPDGGSSAKTSEGAAAQASAPARDALAELAQKLSFTPNANGKLSDFLERFINDTRANFELARQVLAQSEAANAADGTRLMTRISAICDNMEFTSFIRNNLYAQIPVMMGEHSASAELYVFRDKNRRGQTGGYASALVAIDTAGMGRFEAYVVKRERALSCQFRLENEDVQSHVASHLDELRETLEALDYRLENISYKKSDESFTLLHKEAQLEERDGIGNDSLTNEFKRISFDIRV